jgi:heptosyltransferase-2
MVMAQSLYISLQQRFKNAVIDVIAPPWSLPIVARMNHVNRGIALPLLHGEFGFSVRRKLGHSLRDYGYTRTIVLPRSWKAALLPFFARIPQRTGYRGEMRMGLLNDIRVLDASVLTMTVQRYVSLGFAPESPQPPDIPDPKLTVDMDNQRHVTEALGLEREQKAVALMPGAEYGPAKQWPVEYFLSLAQMFVKKGFQVWVLGSEKEKRLGDDIANNQASVYNLCGKTRLEDVIDLLAAARFAVSNDSGLMHVAAAVGIPVVAIYGSSSADFTPPLTDKKYILSRGLECSPCFERHCPLGHYRCLKELRPGYVLDTISSLMD